MAYHMRTIWQARDLILQGKTTAEVARITKMTASAVYMYTKAERAKVKGAKSVAKVQ